MYRCGCLERFEQVAVLDEMAVSEDGEEDALPNAIQGLHAKAFIAEVSWDTVLTVGSGNATRPALISGNNVELFASLNGKRSKVGSVDDIMGEKGFGRLTRTYERSELALSMRPPNRPSCGSTKPAALCAVADYVCGASGSKTRQRGVVAGLADPRWAYHARRRGLAQHMADYPR